MSDRPDWLLRVAIDYWIGVEPGDTVADPVCGNGDLCDVLEAYGCDTIAGDPDPGPVASVPDDPDKIRREMHHAHPDSSIEVYRSAASVMTTLGLAWKYTDQISDIIETIVGWKKPTAVLTRAAWVGERPRNEWAWQSDGWHRPTEVLLCPPISVNGEEITPAWHLWTPTPRRHQTRLRHFSRERCASYIGAHPSFASWSHREDPHAEQPY